MIVLLFWTLAAVQFVGIAESAAVNQGKYHVSWKMNYYDEDYNHASYNHFFLNLIEVMLAIAAV